MGEKEVIYHINAEKGSQVTIANDAASINVSQGINNEYKKNEDDIRVIENLIESCEYKAALDLLRKFQIHVKAENERAFTYLNMGRCYFYLTNVEEFHGDKENNLYNAYYHLNEAEKRKEHLIKKELIDLYILLINTCLELGRFKKELTYYEMGVSICEKKVEMLINNDKTDLKKYRLLLDYALLLNDASQYLDFHKGKEYLMKEYSCYLLISGLEELIDNGVDYDTAFRLFNNAGRCSERLIEYAKDNKEEQQFIKSAEELYRNALDEKLTNLRKYPRNYGMVYNNLGNLYSRKDSQKILSVTYQDALLCFDKSLTAYKNVKDNEKYYEVMSNKARVLNSIYQGSKKDEDYFVTEKFFLEIIDARNKMQFISGVYYSKIHLAQLYINYGQIKQDFNKIQKAIDILNECTEYFTEEYMPDIYYKIKAKRFNALYLLVISKNNTKKCNILLEEIVEFMISKKDKMSNVIIEACADIVIKLFFCIVENDLYEVQKQVYQFIENKFKSINLNIDKYVIKK